MRRYAYRGLLFTRNADFRVGTKPAPALAPVSDGVTLAQPLPVTPSIWRTRTRSSSSSSLGDKSSSSASRHASPRKPPRLVSGLQATQEHVRVPPQLRIEELTQDFYTQLTERLAHLAAAASEGLGDTNQESKTSNTAKSAGSDEVQTLMAMVRH